MTPTDNTNDSQPCAGLAPEILLSAPSVAGWYMVRDTSGKIFKGNWVPAEVYFLASSALRGKIWGCSMDADYLDKWCDDQDTFWTASGPWQWAGPIILPNPSMTTSNEPSI